MGDYMAKICVLDDSTIDKIAAGEVVERPASVVKELVENAMDAGAKAITVEIKEGGIEFIRVTDDGSGIEKDQLRNAFMRHATSKITNVSDLLKLHSMGFRGEALSSIAAVSKVEIITKTKDSMSGTRCCIEGAKETDFEEVGAPDGTTFIVRNLFFNTPVRRKFLKTAMTEASYITDLLEHLALSRPEISFKYVLNGQTKFYTTGDGDLKAVIYRIFGRDIANEMIEIAVEDGNISLNGYLGKPVINRSNRNFENYFVNHRYIKSKIISKAIEEGYQSYMMQHKYPFCVLHINVPPENVDVNVHPTKMEVRFSNQNSLYQMMVDNISSFLKRQEMIPSATLGKDEKVKEVQQKISAPEPFEHSRKNTSPSSYSHDTRPTFRDNVGQSLYNNKIAFSKNEEEDTFFEDNRSNDKKENVLKSNPVYNTKITDKESSGTVTLNNESANNQMDDHGVSKTEENFFDTNIEDNKVQINKSTGKNSGLLAKIIEATSQREPEPTEVIKARDQIIVERPQQLNFFDEKILTKEAKQEYRIVGQVFDTYWIIEYRDKMLMIDQHAAHEKVKYEQILKKVEKNEIYTQILTPPIVISVTPKEASMITEFVNYFKELGFDIEDFGMNAFAIRGVPLDLFGYDIKDLFEEILTQMSESPLRGVPQIIREKIASMACKAAVKGNNSLSYDEADKLINDLLELDNPYNCPHGRPTIISMSKYEVEKKFKRIV